MCATIELMRDPAWENAYGLVKSTSTTPSRPSRWSVPCAEYVHPLRASAIPTSSGASRRTSRAVRVSVNAVPTARRTPVPAELPRLGADVHGLGRRLRLHPAADAAAGDDLLHQLGPVARRMGGGLQDEGHARSLPRGTRPCDAPSPTTHSNR